MTKASTSSKQSPATRRMVWERGHAARPMEKSTGCGWEDTRHVQEEWVKSANTSPQKGRSTKDWVSTVAIHGSLKGGRGKYAANGCGTAQHLFRSRRRTQVWRIWYSTSKVGMSKSILICEVFASRRTLQQAVLPLTQNYHRQLGSPAGPGHRRGPLHV